MLAKFYEGTMMQEMKVKVKSSDSNYQKVKEAIRQYCEKHLGGDLKKIESMFVYDNPNKLSNYHLEKGTHQNREGLMESRLSGSKALEDEITDFPVVLVEIDGEIKEHQIGVDLYETGFIINLGKEATNFFGATHTQYLHKITKGSKNIHLKSVIKSAARTFSTLKSVSKYLDENSTYLHRFVRNNGYFLTVEYASTEFEKNYKDSLNQKKKTSHNEEEKRIEQILSIINQDEEAEPSEIHFGRTQEEEALIRMKEMGLWKDVIDKLEKDQKVMISDVGGIFYDLDEPAKELISAIKERGHFPYLVLRTGRMYSCLFVSRERESWADERLDKKTGQILAVATMGQGGYSSYDFGDITVQLTQAGGLTRIA